MPAEGTEPALRPRVDASLFAVEWRQRRAHDLKRCEDAFGCENDLVWLLDAGSLPPWLKPLKGPEPADMVHRAGEYFRGHAYDDVSLSALATGCANHLRNVYRGCEPDVSDVDLEFRAPNASLVLVRIHPDRMEYLAINDVECFVSNGRESTLVADLRMDAFNAPYLARLHASLRDGDGFKAPLRNEILDDMVRRERASLNRATTFAKFGPFTNGVEIALTGVLPITPGAEIWLFTDGVSRLWRVFDALKPEQLGAAGCSVDELLAAVRSLEHLDPDGRIYPRVSRHDDATAARIRVMIQK